MRTLREQLGHPPLLRLNTGEVDWNDKRALKALIENELSLMGATYGLEKPTELSKGLAKLTADMNPDYFELDGVREWCVRYLELEPGIESRTAVETIIAIIDAFYAGIRVGKTSNIDSDDDWRLVENRLNANR